MRITHQTMEDRWLRDVQDRMRSIDRINRQIGSGVKIDKPSDDPAGASRVVRIQEVVARNEQYLKNIDEAIAVHAATDSALDQVYQNLVRAKSLAVEGANVASTPDPGSFAALADEVAGIRDSLQRIANSRYEDGYLFNGTAGEQEPFGNDYRYLGDDRSLRVNTGGGQSFAVNLPGDVAFRLTDVRSDDLQDADLDFTGGLSFTVGDGSGVATVSLSADYTGNVSGLAADINSQLVAAGLNTEARANDDGTLSLVVSEAGTGGELSVTGAGALGITDGAKNVMTLLEDLEAALRTEDPAAVGQMLDRLDQGLGDVGTQRGRVGARMRNLEFAQDRLRANNLTNETLKAEIEGVDMAEAAMNLSAEEQAYRTALAAAGRLFGVSLLDYLR